jgi:hypothetical protein
MAWLNAPSGREGSATDAAALMGVIRPMREQGASLQAIADQLTGMGLGARTGCRYLLHHWQGEGLTQSSPLLCSMRTAALRRILDVAISFGAY